jgi:hypothetical protein
MTIADVFRFSNGWTVFVGPVEGHDLLVRSVACELHVDGVKRQSLVLDSEMLGGRHDHGHRGVTTKDSVELGADEPATRTCVLIEKATG